MVPTEKGEQWCIERNCIPFFETSAATGDQVEDAFLQIARSAMAQDTVETQLYMSKGVRGVNLATDVQQNNSKNNSCC